MPNDSLGNEEPVPDYAKSETAQAANGISHPLMHRLVIVCQAMSLYITWPLWQTRAEPINLPVFADLPSFSVAWPLLLSLALAFVFPIGGTVVHALLLAAAIVLDQFRLEPQFIGLAVLMIACLHSVSGRIGICYLTTLWLWAGIHKMLSPDWFGPVSWNLVSYTGLDPTEIHYHLAWIVAIGETSVGICCLIRPSIAARLAVALHGGILVYLSPLLAGMNASVIPWNVAMAAVAWTLLHDAKPILSRQRLAEIRGIEWCTAVIFAVVPAGFYGGWVDRSLCHVLYSDSLPRALITHQDRVERMPGWRELQVPFPNERRLFKQYFESTASEGDKLHVTDPRPWLDDQYFVKRNGIAEPISPAAFYRFDLDTVAGIGMERKRSVFALERAGIQLHRDAGPLSVGAITVSKENFRPELLRHLAGLPNLQFAQFADTDISDDDMQHFRNHYRLMGIGLNRTRVTDAGLKRLHHLPEFEYVEAAGTPITLYQD